MTKRPLIVCLCGSARFWQQFQQSYLEETLAGRIVLSIATAPGGNEALFAHLSPEQKAEMAIMLDELHRHKIALADEVFILNVGGYIGSGTERELTYAKELGKRVRFLEDERKMRRKSIVP